MSVKSVMSPPEIAVLNPSAELGGAEYSLLELLKRLQTAYQFHLVLPTEGPLVSLAAEAGVRVEIVPWQHVFSGLGEREKNVTPWKLMRAASCLPALINSLSRVIRRIQPSAIVTNGIKSHVLGTLAVLHRRIPLVWYIRESLEGRSISRRLLSALSVRCDAAVCISHFLVDEMTACFAASTPLHVLYNIVDISHFRPDIPLPPDLQKPNGEVWFGVLGALTRVKGQDLFLQAACDVAERFPAARFFVVGGNSYATERTDGFSQYLQAFVQKSGLSNRVHFLGFRHDVPRILSNLDVLVQPNRGPEGLGRSVLEAMACAVPVISVDRWGPSELISHGANGLKFPPGDVTALSACMLQLAVDVDLRKRFGTNGRRWIETNLAPLALTAGFDGLLKKVIDSRVRLPRSQPRNFAVPQ